MILDDAVDPPTGAGGSERQPYPGRSFEKRVGQIHGLFEDETEGPRPVGQGFSFENSYARVRPRVPAIAGRTIPMVAMTTTAPARVPYTGQSIPTEKIPSMP